MLAKIQEAKQICFDNGQKLTPIREAVLEILMQSELPMSAYDILDKYRESHSQGAQPPTMYRALSFLEENGLIHRMASTRQFVVCDHIGQHHCCDVTQFFICDECGAIEEGIISSKLLEEVNQQAKHIGFNVNQPSLEIHGFCKNCQ